MKISQHFLLKSSLYASASLVLGCAPQLRPESSQVGVRDLAEAVAGAIPVLSEGSHPESFRWTTLRAHPSTQKLHSLMVNAVEEESTDFLGGFETIISGLTSSYSESGAFQAGLPSAPPFTGGDLVSEPSLGGGRVSDESFVGNGYLPTQSSSFSASLSVNPGIFNVIRGGGSGDFANGYCSIWESVKDYTLSCTEEELDAEAVAFIEELFDKGACMQAIEPALGDIPSEITAVVTPLFDCISNAIDDAECATSTNEEPLEIALEQCGLELQTKR